MLKRPHVDEFLQRMGELFECVLFTASLAKVSPPPPAPKGSWGTGLPSAPSLRLAGPRGPLRPQMSHVPSAVRRPSS